MTPEEQKQVHGLALSIAKEAVPRSFMVDWNKYASYIELHFAKEEIKMLKSEISVLKSWKDFNRETESVGAWRDQLNKDKAILLEGRINRFVNSSIWERIGYAIKGEIR